MDPRPSEDYLLASGQGAGKTQTTDELAVELARKGMNVLIAVPDSNMAIMRRNHMIAQGEHPLVVLSHEKLFEKLNPGFDCWKHDQIKHLLELGVSSSVPKARYCKRCPLAEACPYPKQFQKVTDPKYKIVIIQHAHLASMESMRHILSRRFDYLMVDEEFIDNLLSHVKPSSDDREVLLLASRQYDWAKDLHEWVTNGGIPGRPINVSEDSLGSVKKIFDDAGCRYTLPELLRAYRLRQDLQPKIGLYSFHPLPDIPIRILTNATPPVKMLEIVLDSKNIEVVGGDEILDIRTRNPNNKIIQVLDGSSSKTNLLGGKDQDGQYTYEQFVEILERIGDDARTIYRDKKILITTYLDSSDEQKGQFSRIAREWLSLNYPDIMNRILISHMKIGTNEFADYDVQYLLAGVYLGGGDLHRAVYRIKTIANHWNLVHHRRLLDNFHWFDLGPRAGYDKIKEPVRRILPIREGVAGLFEYHQRRRNRELVFPYNRPQDPFYDLAEQQAIAKTQQAIRLRFNDDKEKIVVVFTRYPLPSHLITHSMRLREWLRHTGQV